MHPWIPFLFGRRKRLSDIEFLSIKEFDGKLRQSDGIRTTTGDIATLTATSGKDMYVGKAIINAANLGSGANVDQTITVALKLNAVTVETHSVEFVRGTARSDALLAQTIEFISIGQKVAATQIIKLELITADTTNVTVTGTLVCFEETTGDSPQIG